MLQDPGDVQLVRSGADETGRDSPRRAALVVALMAVVVIGALAAAYFVWRRGPSEPGSHPPAVKVASQSVTVPEQTQVPPLDESDAFVRELVAKLSAHPTVAAWLTTDGLIVNFVVVTTRIAEGRPVSSELKAVGPVDPFRTVTKQGRTYIDPASYRRYDRYAEAVAALDAAGTARLYEMLKPRIRDAHRRFGASDEQADRMLGRAIDQLLKVPVVDGDIELVPPSVGVGYAYADPTLEQLSPAQKQLLRMGPENVRVIQSKLREIAGHLGG